MNKYLEKIALNRYEKHLYNGGATGSTSPYSQINLARARMESAHVNNNMVSGVNDIHVKHIFKQRADEAISRNRNPLNNVFAKGEDILAKKNEGYARVGGPKHGRNYDKGDINYSPKGNIFKTSPKTIPTPVKATSSVLSKAKSLLGHRGVITGGLVAGTVGLGVGAVLSSKKKQENKS